ncbi:hypothetical protein BGZ65_002969 [Modicella reniformis]|uniref:Uncharacterized protein n=1 Tax=Modicella reniformis TaxID=1440133 RepID=A0A9P6SMX0_9FUNG|nr:hypothetical protein BGZ65_002969 [Modicella reniformis]
MSPYYSDLQALKAEYANLQTKLKLTQQTLHGSYQDSVVAQERSKRVETDMGRMRIQMDSLLKKHLDHHPEREWLVQELAELQARFEVELEYRRVLEQKHAALQKEYLRQRLNHTLAAGTGTATVATAATAATAATRSLWMSKSCSALTVSTSATTIGAAATATSSTATSPTLSTRSSSTFVSFFRGVRSTSEGRKSQSSLHIEGSPHLQGVEGGDIEIKVFREKSLKTDREEEEEEEEEGNLHRRTREQVLKREFYEKLQDENVALKMEIEDLRHRYTAEKDSVKGYMSLFEGLQKKQASALAVSQSEIELLRGTIQEQARRLESYERLNRTFAATLNIQVVDLETLTNESCRERVLRAQTEQDMAALLEGSLLILERLFTNVQGASEKLGRVLEPIRQTIQHLEIPSIESEWEQCEQGVQMVMKGLSRSLITQQELQEIELRMGGGELTNGNNRTNSNTRLDPTTHRGSASSTHSALSVYWTQRSPSNRTNNTGGALFDQRDAILTLDNSYSQEIFIWRRSVADTFLEECVKSVENLAREKREFQTRLVELTQQLTFQSERKHSSPDKEQEDPANVQQQKQDTAAQTESAPAEVVNVVDLQIEHRNEDELQLATKRVRQLESIIKKVLEWGEDPVHGNMVNDVLAPGIPNHPFPDVLMEQQPLAITNTEETTNQSHYSSNRDNSQEREKLQALIQLIRQELLSSTVQDNDTNASFSPVIQEMVKETQTPTTTTCNCHQRNTSSSSLLSTSSSTYSLSSTASSCATSTSQRSSCKITGVSIPASPGLLGGIGGPDGKTVLDVDALCRDLAFRSFPQRHHWSKSRSGRTDAFSSLLAWNPVAAAVPVGSDCTGASSTITTKTNDTQRTFFMSYIPTATMMQHSLSSKEC